MKLEFITAFLDGELDVKAKKLKKTVIGKQKFDKKKEKLAKKVKKLKEKNVTDTRKIR